MERVVLHCDCNGFYASVECLLRPELKNVPMAVCGDPASRHGIILAKNELAKRFHIQTAETVWQAKRKCPELVLAAPHREEYQKYSRLVNQIYERFTDQVEPFGIDESWLDVTGSRALFGEGRQIADTIRNTVREELGLTISVGVSFNKIFAKLGSDYKKPDATTEITRENFRQIVWPLPVGALLYVGKSVQESLGRLSIRTIGQLANSDRRLIAGRLGKVGEMIHDYANGRDDSPVRPAGEHREVKSVGNGMTFRRDLLGLADIRLAALALSDSVAARLRAQGLKCRTVQATIRSPDFKTITRQKPLGHASFLADDLAKAAIELVQAGWDLRAPIRMLTITAGNLVPEEEGEQLSLFDQADPERTQKQERLERAMDQIRQRYGHGSIARAGALGNDLGIEDPEKQLPPPDGESEK